MDPYQYRPLTTPNSIRLARVYRAESDMIHVAIDHFDLDTHPLYHALSYTWGSPFSDPNFELDDLSETAALNASYSAERKIPIVCDGHLLYVTKNLHDALQSLRVMFLSQEDADKSEYAELTHFLWIDAISINQNDLRERESQVAVMFDIYKAADLVYIWIGLKLPRTQMALDLLEYIFSLPEEKQALLARYPPPILADSTFPVSNEIGIRPTGQEEWQALYAFLDRGWFHRAWIVQEFAAAPRHRMFCGTTRVYWVHLQALSRIITFTQWHDFFAAIPYWEDTHSIPARSENQTVGVSPFSITQLKAVVDEDWAEQDFSLTSLVQSYRAFKATDPRDMVYSLIYLTRFKAQTRSEVGTILADYSKSVESVYVELTHFLIRADDDLGALTSVVDLGRRTRNTLPSWSVDLTSQLYPTPLQDAWISSDASKGLDFERPTLEDENFLKVRGIRIDKIVDGSLRHTTQEVGQLSSYLELATKLESPYRTYQPLIEVLWRTLIADEAEGSTPADSAYAKHYYNWIMWTLQDILNFHHSRRFSNFPEGYDHMENFKETETALLSILALDMGQVLPPREAVLELLGRIKTRPVLGESVSESRKLYEAAMGRKIHDRCLFVTEGKLLGIAAESFKEGDSLWVLAGSNVPFVLRSMENGHYTLIGDAYVHGIMQGEALEEGDCQIENIVLE